MEDRGLSNIIPSPTPHVWPSLDDLMKGTPTGVPLGSCLCKRTPATCGRRCIMGRRSTSRGKNTMMRSPGIGISDLVLGIIVQKSSNIIIKTDGLGLNGKSFTGTLSPHRTLLSMQAWALLTKPTCRWVYLISEQVIIFLSFRSIFSQKKIGMGWLDPGGVKNRAPIRKYFCEICLTHVLKLDDN